MPVSPNLLAAAAAGRLILAPNTELSAALFDAIERTHLDGGRDIWPTPRVRDFGSWSREQYAMRVAEDPGLPRQLSDIEERELWRQIIEASAAGQDLLDAGVAARAARRARRTVLEYAIPWARVASEGNDETGIFLEWNRAFEERCRALDCIGAEVPSLTLPEVREAPLWVESLAWRPAARRFLENRADLLAPESLDAAQTSVLHAPSPSRELAAMAAWAQERLGSQEQFRAWIYVPGLARRRGEIEDAFDAQLAPERFSLSAATRAPRYALAGGTPLVEYASVRAALRMLEASMGAVGFAEFSALLRAPELLANDAEASAAARIDLLLRRYGPHENTLAGWLSLADRLAQDQGWIPAVSVQRLRMALDALGPAAAARRMSEWISTWMQAFTAAPWCLQQRWSSTEFQAAQRFRELLATLAGADAFFGTHSRAAAQRILVRNARESAFQPQTGIPPVWISGQLLDPWLNYDAVWIAGMNEERWPAPIEPVALLPTALQRAFGVVAADADAQLAASRQLQHSWRQRCTECIFSFSDAPDGSPAAPSALLPTGARALPAHANAAHPHWHALRAGAPPLQKFIDEQAPPFAAGERTRGVHTLRAQSRCAFRGFAEIRLQAEALQLPVPGFDDRERGILVHRALERIWLDLRDSETLRTLSSEARHTLLMNAANQALHAVCRERDPGPRWQARERTRLRNLLDKWLAVECRRSAFVVESVEHKELHARFAGLELRVQIDRIDRLSDGSRVLIDYKTGSAAVDWRGERPSNPQLPIYALLLPEELVAVAYGKVNAADPGFVAESEQKDIFFPGCRKTLLEGQPGLGALIQIWSRRIETLAEAFAAGRAEVAPTADACRSCVLQGLCRVPTLLQDEEDPDE